MTAVLTAESRAVSGPAREIKISLLIEECKRNQIPLLLPDINKSRVDFTIEPISQNQRGIRFGLAAIKNVGEASINSILRARRHDGEFTSFSDLVNRVDLAKVNKKTLESLIKTGALDVFGVRAALLSSMAKIVTEAQKDKQAVEKGQMGLFAVSDNTKVQDHFIDNIEEFSKTELLRFEKELLGFYLTEHPLTAYLSAISNKVTHTIVDLTADDVGSRVIIGGMIQRIKKIIQ